MPTSRRNAGLDPDVDWAEIYRNVALYDFPWDVNQALSFALFRTYAVPSIGRLLDRTGEFDAATQRRHDDTSILLEAPLLHGFGSAEGRAAVRRINQMHHAYDISPDDMRYVLATFVVVPKRWIDDYGSRPLSDVEVRASVRYYQALGAHLGVTDVPATYAAFEQFMDGYEREHFGYDDGARRVADATLALLSSFYPRSARRLVDLFSRALMDPPLLAAFGYREPGAATRRVSRGALRLRGRLVALFPARRSPHYIHATRRIRSYPDGFDLTVMGTFPAGCPARSGTIDAAEAR